MQRQYSPKNFKYIAGIDPVGNPKHTKGSLVIMKAQPNGSYEFYKVLHWSDKWSWMRKLKYRWQIFRLYWLYFRGKAKIIKESNNYTQR